MSRTSHNQQAHGFSLIEVMIVVLIMGIVTAQMFMVLSSQRRTFLINEQNLNTQETARVVSDLISYDARMSGFMVPQMSGVSSVDGGVNNADRLCVSDPTYFDTPLTGAPAPSMDNRGNKFGGAPVTALNPGGSPGTLAIAGQDIDGVNGNDFAAGSGIIITDGQRTHCGQINTVNAGGVVLVNGHDIPGGFPTLGVVAVPAIIYEVQGLNLLRNGVTLSSQVEDLQVQYWVDAETPDGIMQDAAAGGTEWPVFDLNGAYPWVMDLSRVRRIQVIVTSRGTQGTNQEGVQFNRRRLPAAANRVAGPPDDFPRRSFTVDVLPRNLL